MDLQLTDEQDQLCRAIAGLMRRFPLADRAKVLGDSNDIDLMKELDAAGYLDAGTDAGPIEGVLVVEQVAKAGALAPIAARALVGPLMGIADLPPTVALVDRAHSACVPFANDCEAFLVLDDERAILSSTSDVEVTPVESMYAHAAAHVSVRGGTDLGEGSGDRLRRAWRTAIAVEIGHTALAAVEMTVDHVRDRIQFGRPIGSFQAVQHRLASTYSRAHGAIWLGRRAAWFNDDYLAAAAATFACEAADEAYTNCHQVSGAIGITTEYGLMARTLRLVALQRELGGRRAHARSVTAHRRRADLSGLPMPVHPV